MRHEPVRTLLLGIITLFVTALPVVLANSAGDEDELLVSVHVSEGYSVRLLKDGSSEYIGRENVKTLGSVHYKLAPERVAAIAKRVQDARFEELKPGSMCSRTKPEGAIVANVNGQLRSLQICAIGERGLALFRDLQLLLDTEQLRCPFKVRDYGPLGQVDVCRFSEVSIDYRIAEIRKARSK